jgi:hypothetical protein
MDFYKLLFILFITNKIFKKYIKIGDGIDHRMNDTETNINFKDMFDKYELLKSLESPYVSIQNKLDLLNKNNSVIGINIHAGGLYNDWNNIF